MSALRTSFISTVRKNFHIKFFFFFYENYFDIKFLLIKNLINIHSVEFNYKIITYFIYHATVFTNFKNPVSSYRLITSHKLFRTGKCNSRVIFTTVQLVFTSFFFWPIHKAQNFSCEKKKQLRNPCRLNQERVKILPSLQFFLSSFIISYCSLQVSLFLF